MYIKEVNFSDHSEELSDDKDSKFILKLFKLIISLFLTYLILKSLFSVDFEDFNYLLKTILTKKENSLLGSFKEGWKITKINYIWGKINVSHFGKNILSNLMKESYLFSNAKEGSFLILLLILLPLFVILSFVYSFISSIV